MCSSARAGTPQSQEGTVSMSGGGEGLGSTDCQPLGAVPAGTGLTVP